MTTQPALQAPEDTNRRPLKRSLLMLRPTSEHSIPKSGHSDDRGASNLLYVALCSAQSLLTLVWRVLM